jgi:hypothetical protein
VSPAGTEACSSLQHPDRRGDEIGFLSNGYRELSSPCCWGGGGTGSAEDRHCQIISITLFLCYLIYLLHFSMLASFCYIFSMLRCVYVTLFLCYLFSVLPCFYFTSFLCYFVSPVSRYKYTDHAVFSVRSTKPANSRAKLSRTLAIGYSEF